MIKLTAIERIFEYQEQPYNRYIINQDNLLQISESVRHLIVVLRPGKASDWNSEALLRVYLIESYVEDNGDYSFDGDDEYWDSNYQLVENYIPIFYDPISGEKIEIEIVSSINVQQTFDDYQEQCNIITKQRHKLKNYDYGKDVMDKFEQFFSDKYVSNEVFEKILKENNEGGI